jgi:hypothetical protein
MKIYSIVLPYLLLVSFASGSLNNFDLAKINMVNRCPYYGVAVPLINAYDIGKYTYKDFLPIVKRIKSNSQKDIWPWVFLNRIVGTEEKGIIRSPLSKVKYFQNIKGMDLYNKSGALGDFYNIWRIALRAAKETGAPGIFIDLEPYNNYALYIFSNLVNDVGKTAKEVKDGLEKVGVNLVNIANEEYPDATLWFTFTGLSSLVRIRRYDYNIARYLLLGMLARAKETTSNLKIVAGGEVSLEYCPDSLDDLKFKSNRRDKAYAPIMAAYPNLVLGGCIAPWNDYHQKTGWMTGGPCGRSNIENIQGFVPLVVNLLQTYNYVWVYAAAVAPYNPYSSREAFLYNKAISEALAEIKTK